MCCGTVFAQTKILSPHDVESITNGIHAVAGDGKITRESVQCWLDCHAGDFSEIIDFSASLEIGDETVEIPWAFSTTNSHGKLMTLTIS